jgi:hypothetical protein
VLYDREKKLPLSLGGRGLVLLASVASLENKGEGETRPMSPLGVLLARFRGTHVR